MNTAAYASFPVCLPDINPIENINPTIEYESKPTTSMKVFHILLSRKLIPVIDNEVISATNKAL